jgi:K+/H+ antiporter YhaU regulatory subunit KhtT
MNPPPQTRFEAGDILVVMGHRDQVERFLSTFCSMPE